MGPSLQYLNKKQSVRGNNRGKRSVYHNDAYATRFFLQLIVDFFQGVKWDILNMRLSSVNQGFRPIWPRIKARIKAGA
jgi:hypothetical protein